MAATATATVIESWTEIAAEWADGYTSDADVAAALAQLRPDLTADDRWARFEEFAATAARHAEAENGDYDLLQVEADLRDPQTYADAWERALRDATAALFGTC